ncbi:MAG TPA: glycosyltransferase family 2 protein [Methanocella sp.]|jgi:glycosyltransferase involved in cell wall biosynthesis
MENDTATVTVIIPTYRRPELLKRAIRSVQNQTYKNLKICVYDNASGDETESVVTMLAKDDPRISYYCQPKNIGALANFDFGMSRVATPYFSFLSDDDVLLPGFYTTVLEGFECHPDAMFSAGSTLFVNVDTRKVVMQELYGWTRDGYFPYPESFVRFLEEPRGITWTAVLFRREILDQMGGFCMEVGAPMDLDFELRIAARFPYVVSKKPCAIYTIHKASYSLSGYSDYSYFWPGWLKMISNITTDDRIPSDLRACADRILTKRLKHNLFVRGLGLIRYTKFKSAYEVADILRNDFHAPVEHLLVKGLCWSCKNVPLAHALFLGAFGAGEAFAAAGSRKTKTQGSEYVKYLDM